MDPDPTTEPYSYDLPNSGVDRRQESREEDHAPQQLRC